MDIEVKKFSTWVRHVAFSIFNWMSFPLEVKRMRKEMLEPYQLDLLFFHQCLREGLTHFLPRPLQTAIPSFIRMAKPT